MWITFFYFKKYFKKVFYSDCTSLSISISVASNTFFAIVFANASTSREVASLSATNF